MSNIEKLQKIATGITIKQFETEFQIGLRKFPLQQQPSLQQTTVQQQIDKMCGNILSGIAFVEKNGQVSNRQETNGDTKETFILFEPIVRSTCGCADDTHSSEKCTNNNLCISLKTPLETPDNDIYVDLYMQLFARLIAMVPKPN